MFILRSILPAVPPVSLVLDGYTVGAAWSFRRLRSDYAGDCVRIRADGGDDAEDDFGFVDNVVDTVGIASFITTHGGTPKIADWYDQSGNGFDYSQVTTANQPLFVASGINGKPVARFDGSNDVMFVSVAALTLTNADEATVFAVWMQVGTDAQNALFGLSSGPANMQGLATYDNTLYWDFGTADFRVSVAQPGGWDDNPHIIELLKTTADNQQIVVDGVQLISETHTGNNAAATTNLTVGADAGLGVHATGDLGELFFIRTGEGSTNRTTIRENVGDYYGITV